MTVYSNSKSMDQFTQLILYPTLKITSVSMETTKYLLKPTSWNKDKLENSTTYRHTIACHLPTAYRVEVLLERMAIGRLANLNDIVERALVYTPQQSWYKSAISMQQSWRWPPLDRNRITPYFRADVWYWSTVFYPGMTIGIPAYF